MNRENNFDGLSLDELKAKLRDAFAASEDPESDKYIDALEDAIVTLERQAPAGFIPDKKEDLRDLMARMPKDRAAKKRVPRVLSAIFRYGVAAVLAVAVALGSMITAEASGRNVFGTLSDFARGIRGDSLGYTVRVEDNGDMRKFEGMSLKHDTVETVQYFREEGDVDYIVTVESLTLEGRDNGRVPVYFYLLKGGSMTDEVAVEGPGVFTLHGGAGSCVISAVCNSDVRLDFTIERVLSGGEGA